MNGGQYTIGLAISRTLCRLGERLRPSASASIKGAKAECCNLNCTQWKPAHAPPLNTVNPNSVIMRPTFERTRLCRGPSGPHPAARKPWSTRASACSRYSCSEMQLKGSLTQSTLHRKISQPIQPLPCPNPQRVRATQPGRGQWRLCWLQRFDGIRNKRARRDTSKERYTLLFLLAIKIAQSSALELTWGVPVRGCFEGAGPGRLQPSAATRPARHPTTLGLRPIETFLPRLAQPSGPLQWRFEDAQWSVDL